MDHPDWWALAECAGLDPELFYADRGDNVTTDRAKAVCRRCPVRAECLAYALANRETHGVWGDTTPLERRALRRRHLRLVRLGRA